MNHHPSISIGIDIGGTFTDFVVFHAGEQRLETFKLLSTPRDPSEAVLVGLRRIRNGLPAGAALHVVHGSTVATNALLERKGARTAFIATQGFKDLLQIGRQNRPELYNLAFEPLPPLVPAELRFEVDERVSAQGEILQALDAAQVAALAEPLRAAEAESVAVCLLFSFLHPEHEQQIATALRRAGFFVSASHEVLPEYREYERASTTAVNAYVSPALDRYLSRLEAAEPGLPIRVMQSNGGSISLEQARRSGVHCILSGPAGGVVGAQVLAHVASPQQEHAQVITFDMGGTSTDVALIDGAPRLATDAAVGGCPIRIPLLDIHTIGAGGGSIAYADAGGALRVGPGSAGADPGPACYGRGELPTVTDANLLLGRLPGERFLGGQMPLDIERSRSALRRLGAGLGLDACQAALGVIEVVNAHMERALRVISVERGYDPRGFTLLSFGGAGGLHAADLARRLGMPRVLVPPVASTLSAFGMLAADVVKDYSLTVMLPGPTPLAELVARLAPMVKQARTDLHDEGVTNEAVQIEASLDMRYCGQSYELNVRLNRNPVDDFHQQHTHAYGYARPEAAVEIVNLRVRAVGRGQPPQLAPLQYGGPDPSAALLDWREAILPGGASRLPLYEGERLQSGAEIPGPALIARADTTILIGPADQAMIDLYGNVNITIGHKRPVRL